MVVIIVWFGMLGGMTTGFLLLWWIVAALVCVSVLVLVVFGILRLTKRNDE